MDERTARTAAVAWRKAGRRLGLSGPGLLAGLQLDGCIGSFGVRVEQPHDRTRIVVHDERPSALSSLRWRAGAAEATTDAVATGDAAFDSRVAASGDPVVIAGFFDASMRRRTLRATAGGGGFEDGILTVERPSAPRSATDLVSAIRRAIGFARRMSTPRDVAARLAANALSDPVPAVRLHCLERLREAFPGRATRVLRAALRDPDPGVRLRAATLAPEEGRRVLLALAQGFRLDETLQATAIAALVRPPALGPEPHPGHRDQVWATARRPGARLRAGPGRRPRGPRPPVAAHQGNGRRDPGGGDSSAGRDPAAVRTGHPRERAALGAARSAGGRGRRPRRARQGHCRGPAPCGGRRASAGVRAEARRKPRHRVHSSARHGGRSGPARLRRRAWRGSALPHWLRGRPAQPRPRRRAGRGARPHLARGLANEPQTLIVP